MEPLFSEPICLVSYEVTKILLAGEPQDRPGFWKAYRQELEYNQKTEYNNYRLSICRHHLDEIAPKFAKTWYFRDGKLIPQ
jgi:hypothetical protein